MSTIIDVLAGRCARRLAFAIFVSSALASAAAAADIEAAVDLGTKGNAQSVQSQKRINKIDDQSDQMATDYRSTIDQIESLRVYNAQLDKLLAAQQAELDSLDEQIGNVTKIGREVTPLMIRMVDALESFIELDVPMLLGERRDRAKNIRGLLDRADVEDSEKYRRITEAYQIENEYGRTIESYQDTLVIGGEERTLDFLRIGRVALMYRTLDGKEVGAWDSRQKTWVELPSDFRDSIKEGIRIANKQAAPQLIRIPVVAPEDAQP